MDLAQTLIKSVMRAFYDTRTVLVVDALIIHSALRDDDLAHLMRTNPKELQKVCGKLRGDRFLSVHTRPETKEGMMRPINRTYYYIDYRQAIDAIKWRVYSLGKDLQGGADPNAEKKEYFCAYCKAEWTLMEVLDSPGPNGFLCHRCSRLLTHDLERNSSGHEQSTRLNNQLKFITELLPRIDNAYIPDNTFDVAFGNRRPIVRDPTHPGNDTIPVDSPYRLGHQPAATKGLATTGPVSVTVNISASDGPTEAEKAAALARKEKLAQQNALPSWMSKSTVTGESFSATAAAAANHAGSAATRPEAAGAADPAVHSFEKDHSNIDDYFARLKQQAAQEEALKGGHNDDDEEGQEEDEDEDDFEDVVGTTTTTTAATSMTTTGETGDDKDSGRFMPSASMPVVQFVEPADDLPPRAKKARLDQAPAATKGSNDESEDELEFEDV